MRARTAYAVFLVILLAMTAIAASATSWAYSLRHAGEVDTLEVRVGGQSQLIHASEAGHSDYSQRALRSIWGIHEVTNDSVDPDDYDLMTQRSEYVRVELPPDHPLRLPHLQQEANFTEAYFFVSDLPWNPEGDVVLCEREADAAACAAYRTHEPFGPVPGAEAAPA